MVPPWDVLHSEVDIDLLPHCLCKHEYTPCHYLIYRIYSPNYHNSWSHSYCNEMLYKFAFYWQLSHYIPFFIGLIIACCTFSALILLR